MRRSTAFAVSSLIIIAGMAVGFFLNGEEPKLRIAMTVAGVLGSATGLLLHWAFDRGEGREESKA